MLFITLHFSHIEEKFLTVEGRKLGVAARPLESSIFKTDSEYVLNMYEYLQTPTVQLCDFASLHRLSKNQSFLTFIFVLCVWVFFFLLICVQFSPSRSLMTLCVWFNNRLLFFFFLRENSLKKTKAS